MPLLKDISYCYSLKSYSQISNLSRLSEASYKKLSSSRYFLPSFKNMENDIPFSANNVIWNLVSKAIVCTISCILNISGRWRLWGFRVIRIYANTCAVGVGGEGAGRATNRSGTVPWKPILHISKDCYKHTDMGRQNILRF